MKKRFLLPVALGVLGACNNTASDSKQTAFGTDTTVRDTHTLSNADSVVPKHVSLDLAVDFGTRQLSGTATWQIQNRLGAKEFVTDDAGLQIEQVWADGTPVNFYTSPPVQYLGTALHIPIGSNTQTVRIRYKTGAEASALQWLAPAQTSYKTDSFLYTQSEAIHARSWVPAPDGPGIRFTYDARIRVPKGLLVLMSATNPQAPNDSGIYTFRMEEPVPAYLMALAVGKLEFQKIDDRTGVYAEPGVLSRATWELNEMPKMVQIAEGLYGPYRWGRYDVLILPPGFPIGGMENPRLTFATPTILAGDRSLANLIAHELAHNWSGNLVTSATWNDIWMNEGFTVYFERRITEAMLGKSYVDMLWALGYQDLEKAVVELGPQSRATWLKNDLTGQDPEECLTDVPYEKGSLLLWMLERQAGREKWDAFLKAYFNRHAFGSITTEQFLNELHAQLSDTDSTLEKKIRIREWVYGPGIPDNAPQADSARFTQVNAIRNAFLSSGTIDKAATQAWTTHEWLHFLRNMPRPLTVPQMRYLDGQFGFTKSKNSEIADLWFETAIHAKYITAYPEMEDFLSKVGRQKFLTPLYTALKESDQVALAQRYFETYHNAYHPIAQARLRKLLTGS
ncbi:MAG: M1 family peptidase [Sphingobacteriales bacterium]|nr:MAG: M1 family peptidase [Sphingobacteriales bacterium]